MARGGPPRVVVSVVIGAGRGLAARPAFEAGRPVPLLRRAQGTATVGDLVTVRERGRTAEVLGVHGPTSSPTAVMSALLANAGIRVELPSKATREADAIPGRLGGGDPGRRDMSGQVAVTIDPEGAKDHDDAIAVAAEGEDIRLWVHIADVARYVVPGGAIDREAARRGNSVYVPGMVAPMLPPRLSNDLCSLRPGEPRDVVTAEMVVHPDGTVSGEHFYRSEILSRERLTYATVDGVLAGDIPGPEGLGASITLAAEAARRLLARRRARGTLEVHSGEPAFTVSASRVEGGGIEAQTTSHSLVEECMIAANEAVARFLVARRAPTVFRYHEDPAGSAVARMYDQLAELGVPVPPIADGPLGPQQAREAVAAAAEALGAHLATLGEDGRRAGPALWGLVLRSLRQAYYSPDQVGHSGLASPAYLHFTSPIRRYPDLLVHRALLDQLGIGDPGPDPATCAEAAAHSSETEREAVRMERRADRVTAALLLERLIGEEALGLEHEGTVSGVIDGGLFVTFGEVFDGFLPVRRLGADWFRTHPLEVGLIGEGTGRRVMIGDPITVRIVRIEALRGRVELEPAALGPSRVLARRRARLGGA